MAQVSEISDGVYRLTVDNTEFQLQFSHFLIDDEEPLLFHTGFNATFGELHEAVATVLDPSKLRWISFSHFESDECGSLNRWLEQAPDAEPVCTFLAANVNLRDFSIRPARALEANESLETGKRRFSFLPTAHVPHGWDAGVMFEHTERTLFCSDLLLQQGDLPPVTESDIVGSAREALVMMRDSPLGFSVPYTPQTDAVFERLAALEPKTLAVMHGSVYRGNGAEALRDFASVVREVHG